SPCPPPGREKAVLTVTIHDVADRAGVSIKTVSRVLNKEPNVRQETRDRVLAAAEALHYRPSVSARSLAGSRSYLIALFYAQPGLCERRAARGGGPLPGGRLPPDRRADRLFRPRHRRPGARHHVDPAAGRSHPFAARLRPASGPRHAQRDARALRPYRARHRP